MKFEHPEILWLLLVLPTALAAFFWRAARKKQKLLAQFIQTRLLSALTVGVSPARQKFRFALLILAVVLFILTLARPQYGFDLEKVEQRGLDIMVAIDTSKSMLAEDIAPDRLERAKLAALELMQDAKPDRLGLVAFAGDAFLECPLTFDSTAFQQCVQVLDINSIPQGGTAIAAAIQTAQTAFKENDHYKVLVLFTDGEDNDGGALQAAQAAAKAGLKIFTIGIGTPQGDLLRIADANGNSDYVRDADGNVVKSHLNEALLQQIAGAAGGFYLPLRPNTVDTLYEKGLAPLPQSEAQERLVQRYHEQFHWPLAAAILLLLAEIFLPERKHTANATARMAAVVALFLLPGIASGSPSSALREYNAGQYDNALKEYQRLSQRGTDDPRLYFDAGASAYRAGKLDEAATNFSTVVTAPDLKLQELGYYNLGNTLYHLGEQNPDSDKKRESWENALKNYDSTLKLNPQDADAKFNYAFLKKKLEELKKQQQQHTDQQKNNQPQNQNQQNQQQAQNNQSQQSQQNQNSNSQPAQQNSQPNQQPDQQAQNQSNQQNQQSQKQQTAEGPSNPPKGESLGKENGEQAANTAEMMTPQEAKQLLDAQKGNEQVLQLKPKGSPQNSVRPYKDW